MTKGPDIVYIDDEPQGLIAAAKALRAGARFQPYAPPCWPDSAAGVAAQANLWVFDFYNDDSQRENPALTGVATNGLSVFQQFRLLVGDARPPAVLVSNHLEQALGSDIRPERRHIIAEQVGVEWVSAKVGRGNDPIKEILALADSVATLRALSARLTASDPGQYVAELSTLALKLPRNVSWVQSAVKNVAEWRPPVWVNGVQRVESPRRASSTHPEIRSARDVIAWLVRQVLPYPSFLVREQHLAVRLGITLKCLAAALKADTLLAKRARRCSYRGILEDFDGPRWWATGVDALSWSLPRDKTARSAALAKLVAPIPLRELKFTDPVVVSDADLIETNEIAEVSTCVRAADEYFPSQAGPAWVKIINARHDLALARKVKLEDQPDLSEQP